nr:MAG TPA: hypothetical protein [Caudoviricetes sp.]
MPIAASSASRQKAILPCIIPRPQLLPARAFAFGLEEVRVVFSVPFYLFHGLSPSEIDVDYTASALCAGGSAEAVSSTGAYRSCKRPRSRSCSLSGS